MTETAVATLAESVRNAETLVAYAAENGLLKDRQALNAIVAIKPLLAQGQVSAATEAEFWESLNAVAGMVKPATVESLEATRGVFEGTSLSLLTGQRQSCRAERAVRRYRRWALIALLWLVATQTYYLVGSTVLSDIEAIMADDEKVAAARVAAQASLSGAESPTQSTKSNALTENEIGRLDARDQTNQIRLQTSYDVLRRWNTAWRVIIAPWQVMEAAAAPHVVASDAPCPPPMGSTEALRQNIEAETTARFALKSLQLYILPFLYGFLGTCVYILRSLATEIKVRAFSSDVAYRLRMPLGALAGVAVAWFITPESSPAIVKSLSPLAIAFLAGYSVEVLFAGMDRVIGAFSTEANPSAAPAATK